MGYIYVAKVKGVSNLYVSNSSVNHLVSFRPQSTMTLYENGKALHGVTHQFNDLATRDDNGDSQHNGSDRPPPYEALFATTSTPSSFEPLKTQPQSTETLTLPCVIPRESFQNLFRTKDTS
jgi:hypothetical protein